MLASLFAILCRFDSNHLIRKFSAVKKETEKKNTLHSPLAHNDARMVIFRSVGFNFISIVTFIRYTRCLGNFLCDLIHEKCDYVTHSLVQFSAFVTLAIKLALFFAINIYLYTYRFTDALVDSFVAFVGHFGSEMRVYLWHSDSYNSKYNFSLAFLLVFNKHMQSSIDRHQNRNA